MDSYETLDDLQGDCIAQRPDWYGRKPGHLPPLTDDWIRRAFATGSLVPPRPASSATAQWGLAAGILGLVCLGLAWFGLTRQS
jgi:hypothetical protein